MPWGDLIPLCSTPRCFPVDMVLEKGCAGRRTMCRRTPSPLLGPGRGIEPGLVCETLYPSPVQRRQVLGARGCSAWAGGVVSPTKVLRAPRPAACVLACPCVLVP